MQKLYPTSNSETWLIPTGLLTSIKYNYYFQIWPYNGYKNIFLFDVSKKSDAFILTHHHFDVTEILSVNEKRGEIYYLATNGDPKQRHLFRKHITDVNSHSECLSCKDIKNVPKTTNPLDNLIELTDGKSCLYHSASFSLNSDYYVLECLGDRIPITFIKNVEEKTISEEANNDSKSIEILLFLIFLIIKMFLYNYFRCF